MNRSNTWLIAAGALLIVLTNAVVLVGVASNRRQPPDSVLTLTERELGPPWSWMWQGGENSGVSLQLKYRVESAPESTLVALSEEGAFSTYLNFGPIAWLDRDKLAALGFDAVTLSTVAGGDTHYRRMPGRDVLLVLELDGSVRVRALHAARDHFAHLEQEIAANPGSQGSAQRLQRARQALRSEEQEASRLFIVDAGLDQSTLRQRYSDRTHYAIVHGNISPIVIGNGTSARVYGAVTAVRCENINVPLQFRTTVSIDRPINAIVVPPTRDDKKSPFTVRVAFGRHLEPWIVGISF